jgi:hypothetical protein
MQLVVVELVIPAANWCSGMTGATSNGQCLMYTNIQHLACKASKQRHPTPDVIDVTDP